MQKVNAKHFELLTRCKFIITRASIKTWASNFIFILKQSITILRLLLCFQAFAFLLDVTSWQSEHSFSSTLLKNRFGRQRHKNTDPHTYARVESKWERERYKYIEIKAFQYQTELSVSVNWMIVIVLIAKRMSLLKPEKQSCGRSRLYTK